MPDDARPGVHARISKHSERCRSESVRWRHEAEEKYTAGDYAAAAAAATLALTWATQRQTVEIVRATIHGVECEGLMTSVEVAGEATTLHISPRAPRISDVSTSDQLRAISRPRHN